MINREDLMVGDLVYNHRKWECPVVEILSDGATVIARHYGKETFRYEDLSPIPLTKEILEKNGFSYERMTFARCDWDVYKLSNELYFAICGDIIVCGYYNGNRDNPDTIEPILNIRYVHELQHALKLCGVKKEIVL